MIEAPGEGVCRNAQGNELTGGQTPAIGAGPGYVPRIRGSSASRRPSPM